jgi:hypothetical protein
MMAVAVKTGATLSVGEPQVVFEGPDYVIQGSTSFDVSADGKRVLTVKETERAMSITHINLVLNWAGELKRLVPTN